MVRQVQLPVVTMRLPTTVLAAMLLATGCVGTVEDIDPIEPGMDAGTNPTAKEGKNVYIRDVHPVLIQKCATAACHAQAGATGMYGFAIPDASSSYTQVTTLPTLVGTYTAATAGLITKVDAGHNNATYTAAERTKITAWFAQEVADRNDDPTVPPPVDPIEKLRAWTGCMNIANFAASNMTTAWSQLGADNSQSCLGCHNGGLESFLISSDEAIFFKGISEQKDFLLKYFTVDSLGKVIINMGSMNSAGVTLPGHPRFNPTTNAGMLALTEFYDLTLAAETAGTCLTPTLLP